MENIEIIEFENKITQVFKDNLLKVESIITNSYILKEEITIILKLKILTEFCKNKGYELDIIKKIMIKLLEINEFKNVIIDDYGIGKEGYWSFRKDFRNKELEIIKLEYEFYSYQDNSDLKMKHSQQFDCIALKFINSLIKTNRRGWL
ncbi:MAG: hypothetical protein IJ104_01720 [Methanobrevibacter sp.]|nr:hypothetical protein [Methanobrevibacter sp.]